jgi:hypothetical protein
MAVKRRFCEVCKAEIPTERIEAMPETRRCVGCSQSKGTDVVIEVQDENLAKTNSLKKNYGAVTVKKKRRVGTSRTTDV